MGSTYFFFALKKDGVLRFRVESQKLDGVAEWNS